MNRRMRRRSRDGEASGGPVITCWGFAAIALATACIFGCGESEIEPRSAASVAGDAWDPFTDAPRNPAHSDLPTRFPPPMPVRADAVAQQAPPSPPEGETMASTYAPPRRAHSISLGYVGDAPLTQSEPTPPRWPW